MQLQVVDLVLIVVFATGFSSAKDEKLPEGITRELYCTGCELTVKEIHSDLSHHTGEDMGKRIKRIMKNLCQKKYFESHETGAEKLVKICKHFIKNHALDIEPVLRRHYHGQSHVGESYLCMSQKICIEVTPACKGIREKPKEEINCDHEEDFLKHFDNKKVKKVNPVHESVVRDHLHHRHEEL